MEKYLIEILNNYKIKKTNIRFENSFLYKFLKKSKNGKNFYVVKVIDDNNETTVIRCWGVDPERDIVHINRPYMARLNYNQQWGFSTFSMKKMFKLLA